MKKKSCINVMTVFRRKNGIPAINGLVFLLDVCIFLLRHFLDTHNTLLLVNKSSAGMHDTATQIYFSTNVQNI